MAEAEYKSVASPGDPGDPGDPDPYLSTTPRSDDDKKPSEQARNHSHMKQNVVVKVADGTMEQLLRTLLKQIRNLLAKGADQNSIIHSLQILLSYIKGYNHHIPSDIISMAFKLMNPVTKLLVDEPLVAVGLLENARLIASQFGVVQYQIKFSIQMPEILLPKIELHSDDTMKQLRRAVQECASAHFLLHKFLDRKIITSPAFHRGSQDISPPETFIVSSRTVEKLGNRINSVLSTLEKMFLLYSACHLSFHPNLLHSKDPEITALNYQCLIKLTRYMLSRGDIQRARALFPPKISNLILQSNSEQAIALLSLLQDINDMELRINHNNNIKINSIDSGNIKRTDSSLSSSMKQNAVTFALNIENGSEIVVNASVDNSGSDKPHINGGSNRNVVLDILNALEDPSGVPLESPSPILPMLDPKFIIYRNAFAELRKQVPLPLLAPDDQGNLDTSLVNRAQLRLTKGIREIIANITQEVLDLSGPPPCNFCVVGLGSHGRAEVAPYSDFEFALLTEYDIDGDESLGPDGFAKSYFGRFVEMMDFMVNCLGEPTGFRLDTQGTPKEYRFRGKPNQIVERAFRNLDIQGIPMAFSLLQPACIFAAGPTYSSPQSASGMPRKRIITSKRFSHVNTGSLGSMNGNPPVIEIKRSSQPTLSFGKGSLNEPSKTASAGHIPSTPLPVAVPTLSGSNPNTQKSTTNNSTSLAVNSSTVVNPVVNPAQPVSTSSRSSISSASMYFLPLEVEESPTSSDIDTPSCSAQIHRQSPQMCNAYNLFANYQDLVISRLQNDVWKGQLLHASLARYCLQDHIKMLAPGKKWHRNKESSPEEVHLKDHFLTPLICFTHDIALYYMSHIPTVFPDDASATAHLMDSLSVSNARNPVPIISPFFASSFRDAWAALNAIRIRAELAYGEQIDAETPVYLSPQSDPIAVVLTPTEKYWLSYVEWVVQKPLYRVLSTFLEAMPPATSFTNLSNLEKNSLRNKSPAAPRRVGSRRNSAGNSGTSTPTGLSETKSSSYIGPSTPTNTGLLVPLTSSPTIDSSSTSEPGVPSPLSQAPLAASLPSTASVLHSNPSLNIPLHGSPSTSSTSSPTQSRVHSSSHVNSSSYVNPSSHTHSPGLVSKPTLSSYASTSTPSPHVSTPHVSTPTLTHHVSTPVLSYNDSKSHRVHSGSHSAAPSQIELALPTANAVPTSPSATPCTPSSLHHEIEYLDPALFVMEQLLEQIRNGARVKDIIDWHEPVVSLAWTLTLRHSSPRTHLAFYRSFPSEWRSTYYQTIARLEILHPGLLEHVFEAIRSYGDPSGSRLHTKPMDAAWRNQIADECTQHIDEAVCEVLATSPIPLADPDPSTTPHSTSSTSLFSNIPSGQTNAVSASPRTPTGTTTTHQWVSAKHIWNKTSPAGESINDGPPVFQVSQFSTPKRILTMPSLSSHWNGRRIEPMQPKKLENKFAETCKMICLFPTNLVGAISEVAANLFYRRIAFRGSAAVTITRIALKKAARDALAEGPHLFLVSAALHRTSDSTTNVPPVTSSPVSESSMSSSQGQYLKPQTIESNPGSGKSDISTTTDSLDSLNDEDEQDLDSKFDASLDDSERFSSEEKIMDGNNEVDGEDDEMLSQVKKSNKKSKRRSSSSKASKRTHEDRTRTKSLDFGAISGGDASHLYSGKEEFTVEQLQSVQDEMNETSSTAPVGASNGKDATFKLTKLEKKKAIAATMTIERVIGENLETVLMKEPERLQELDHQSFTDSFLASLFFISVDRYPSDFTLQSFTRVDKDNNLHDTLRLVVSRHQTPWGEESMMTETATVEGFQLHVHRNILFCLDQMRDPLDADSVYQFLDFEPISFITSWIKELKSVQSRWNSRFAPSEVRRFFQPGSMYTGSHHADLIALPDHVIPKLTTLMTSLQQTLRANPRASHLEILKSAHPVLGYAYNRAHISHNTSVLQRFEGVGRPVPVSAIYRLLACSSDVNKFKAKKSIHTLVVSELQQQLQQILKEKSTLSDLRVLVMESFTHARWETFHFNPSLQQRVLDNLDHKDLPLPVQAALYTLFESSQHKLSEITIRNSDILDNASLDLLLRQNTSHITKLHLPGCHRLENRFIGTSDVIKLLSENCTGLASLDLSGTNIKYFALQQLTRTAEIKFEKLEWLNLDHCRLLEKVKVNAPALWHIDARHCSELIKLEVDTNSFATADLLDCPKMVCSSLLLLSGINSHNHHNLSKSLSFLALHSRRFQDVLEPLEQLLGDRMRTKFELLNKIIPLDFVKCLAAAFSVTHLNEIILQGCEIEDEAIRCLAEACLRPKRINEFPTGNESFVPPPPIVSTPKVKLLILGTKISVNTTHEYLGKALGTDVLISFSTD